MFYSFHFHISPPSQKRVMRSSSIESNNTTRYNRRILCNRNNWENLFFFPLFYDMFMPIFRVQPLTHRQLRKKNKGDALCLFREEKSKNAEKQDIVVLRELNGSTADKATNYRVQSRNIKSCVEYFLIFPCVGNRQVAVSLTNHLELMTDHRLWEKNMWHHTTNPLCYTLNSMAANV